MPNDILKLEELILSQSELLKILDSRLEAIELKIQNDDMTGPKVTMSPDLFRQILFFIPDSIKDLQKQIFKLRKELKCQ